MIIDNFDKNKIFSRRLFFVIWVKTFLIGIITLRLFYLQIIKNDKFNKLSDKNKIRSIIIPPLRGNILDKNNNILASNNTYYRVLLNNNPNININKTLDKLSKIINIDKKKFLYHKNNIRKSHEGSVLIYDDLTYSQISKIEVNIPELPGIYIETGQKRFYPYKEITSNIIGYVSTVTEKELAKTNNTLLKHPDFKIGKNGIEKIYEKKLRGKAGVTYLEEDAHGYTIGKSNIEKDQKMKAGENVKLTIDVELQKYVYKLTEDKRAAINLINIENGNIISQISSPSFDPNIFLKEISKKDWHELINNPAKPLQNKALSNNYPPGSTFKLIVALAALENNFNPNTKFKCNGKIRLGRRWFHCWKKEGHGILDLNGAIKESCNCYFYQMSRKVGIKNITKTAKEFGLGSKTSDKFYNEEDGLLPSKKWKKNKFKQPWVLGDTFNSSIGQGFLQTTPIQLAVMVSRLISQKKIIPNIIENNNERTFENLDFKKENIKYIMDAMFDVVNSKKGTAYWQRLKYKNFKYAGKTGTSQVVAINHKEKEKKIEDIELRKRNHALFVGFAPFHKPKYAISVVVEHGGSGSVAAAPIAKEIFKKIAKAENYT